MAGEGFCANALTAPRSAIIVMLRPIRLKAAMLDKSFVRYFGPLGGKTVENVISSLHSSLHLDYSAQYMYLV
jgi:hypothetical protein